MKSTAENKNKYFKYKKKRLRSSMWEPSESSHRCSHCYTDFTFFVRRHHCRVCGKIFCDACSNQRVRIPSVMDACIVQSPEGGMISSAMRWMANTSSHNSDVQRVCVACRESIHRVEESRKIIDLILVNPHLIIIDWRTMRLVCQKWKVAAETLLQTWKTTGFLPPYKPPSISQRKLIRTNTPLLSGHIAWLGRAGNGFRCNSNCESLECRTNCRTIPVTIKRIINMFISGNISSLPSASNVSPECITAIASRSTMDARVFEKIVLPICSVDSITAQKLFFQINGRDPVLAAKLMQVAPSSAVLRWRKSLLWIEAMKSVAQWKDSLHVEPSDWKGATLPQQPDVEIIQILHDAVTVKKSSTNPVVIPCVCKNSQGNRFVQCYMMKEESCLSDAIVQDLCAMIKLIAKCEKKGAMLITYDVLPLSRDTGMITLVPGCTTLGRLRSEGQSITSFILENNAEENIKGLKYRFMGSCAATTVVSTILSVGDRHLDNLCCTRRGELFGVDFAYILGKEPFGKEILGNSLRLTPQIIEFLGGIHSMDYTLFKNVSSELYNLCRRYLNLLYPIMEGFVWDGITTRNELNAHIENAFLPSGDDISCKIHIENRIERVSRGSSSWKDTITDSLHSLWNS